ncbi:MAG: Smr/MutS family protein [Myxococcota bacterium]
MAREPDEDERLFAEAVAGVSPLTQNRRPPAPVYREPTPLSEREREVIRELDAIVSGEAPFDARDSDDFMSGCVPGLDPRVLRSLRKGEFTPQADLDLHGSDAASARGLVESFVVTAHARGLRCLRIVHGRGNRSPNGEPVLKPSLPRWLGRGPARRIVLAYSSAPQTDGGTGATYVLLRKGGAARR